MNLLLDTHPLLWWLDDNPTLSASARQAIGDGKNTAFVSVAALWEIRIKEALGKLELPGEFEAVLDKQPFLVLDVKARHVHALKDLPMPHRDPFDRLLVTQARTERLTLVTRDPAILSYGVAHIVA
ncbi:MAG: type II toxin-antitoxin system VapC family toxin [Deltaproteobacteria bacterium]|nr:type II toxin-antitoxin system VapC family toxin [Deltaproteobacteria bacterium]